MDPETNAIRNDELQYTLEENEPEYETSARNDVRDALEHRAKGNGKLTQFKQRIMNRVQRRREGWSNRHATPTARTGQPPHRVQWSTATDQSLVLDAIRLGLVQTGSGRPVWGKGGIFRSRKALFVAVAKAKAAGWPTTSENEATAATLKKHWEEQA